MRARVVQLDRSYPLCELEDGRQLRAEHAIALLKDRHCDMRAAIGDYVELELPEGHDKGIITEIYERRTALGRWDGSSMGKVQVLAANVDCVVALVPLSKKSLDELELQRMLKALVLAHEASCEAIVVLSKRDRKRSLDDLQADLERVQAYVGKVPLMVCSSQTGEGIEELRERIDRPGYTSILIGKSGAGKSSLVNALVGEERFDTKEVRERDDRGRHTTVARTLISLAGGGALIDAPGLRSFPLRGHEKGLEGVFPEIYEAAERCYFRDCLHEAEPGCAVRKLVEEGKLSALRLEAFRSMVLEMQRMEEKLDLSIRKTRR